MNQRMEHSDPPDRPPSPEPLAVLDVRDGEAFARGHLAGSGHVPLAELAARRSELPPRESTILVVAETAAAAAAGAAALEALGYAKVFHLDAPVDALTGACVDRSPAVRLWRPSPFLEEVLPRIVGSARTEDRPAGSRPRALDLACGAGRDAVHLAGQGFEVEAWDHDPEALARAQALARRHGATLRTVRCDLERAELPPPSQPFDLIVCFRFLHRPLFPWIERALAPGGWLAYETYRAGQERFGRPIRPQFLLAPGELATALPGLETILYEERDPPEGPVTARLLARRPGRG